MFEKRHDIKAFLNEASGVVAVTVDATKGSAPRNAGAWMLVSASSIFRTIGGGSLEFMAIDKARLMLANRSVDDVLNIPLGPEIGQCCGGHVTLNLKHLAPSDIARYVERIDQEMQDLPRIFVFGAGHVGNALVEALSLLPLRPVLVDTRADELAAAPGHVKTILAAIPEDVVRSAPAGSGYVILTHDHSLDFLIAKEALARTDANYIGMIGSKTKRAVFSRWYKEEVTDPARLDELVCPIGTIVSNDKRPEVIACFVVAEIMAHFAEAGIENLEQSPLLAAQQRDEAFQ